MNSQLQTPNKYTRINIYTLYIYKLNLYTYTVKRIVANTAADKELISKMYK